MSGRSFLSDRTKRLGVSPIREIFEIAAKIKDAVRLEIGEPDFDTPPYIVDACKAALDQGFTHYTSFGGILELRRALAAKLERENGVRVDPDTQVVITPGGTGAIYEAVQATVDPGDEVLLPSPGWPQYTSIVQLAGGVPVYYPLLEEDGFMAKPERIAPLITGRTKVLLLNSPSNPTGGVVDRPTVEALCELVKGKELLLFSDEVYERILYDGAEHVSPASLPGMAGRTVTINAASKTFAMTGWRIGYAAGPAEIISEMSKLNLYTNTHPNSFCQKACVVGYENQDDDFLREMVETYQQRRDFMVKNLNELPGIRCPNPKGAFYLFPNIEGTGLDSMGFAKVLLEKGHVATVPGNGFGPQGEGYLRLCFAQSMEELEKAVDRMAKVTKALKG
ncbi:MAG: pyridoxal phosphate-dependent aminotransferase [Candidatus Tectomicrobia bacterium]|nr:pyridoxal phosphate-dependent aminotransferase [Candidatus Tectomicrobia bacterium]